MKEQRLFGLSRVDLSAGEGNPDEAAYWINKGLSPRYKAGSAEVLPNGTVIAKRYLIKRPVTTR